MSKIKFESSVISRATQGYKEAISTLFLSFIGSEEEILDVWYLGNYGLFFNKIKSFVCLTDKRIATIKLGKFGKIIYQDAFIEEINSGIIYQPSLFTLYFVSIVLACTIVGALLIPMWINIFYTFNKSGMVWSIREGIDVYAFANQSRINDVNKFWRHVANVRNQRIIYLKKI